MHLEHLKCSHQSTGPGAIGKKRIQLAGSRVIGIGLRAREPWPWGGGARSRGMGDKGTVIFPW